MVKGEVSDVYFTRALQSNGWRPGNGTIILHHGVDRHETSSIVVGTVNVIKHSDQTRQHTQENMSSNTRDSLCCPST